MSRMVKSNYFKACLQHHAYSILLQHTLETVESSYQGQSKELILLGQSHIHHYSLFMPHGESSQYSLFGRPSMTRKPLETGVD